jgi:zinc protease
VLNKPSQLPLQMFSYHVPRTDSPEHYAIEVLSNVLMEGRSSRLYRRLVDRDQLAIGVGGGTEYSLDPGQLVFTVQPRSGVDPARSEQAFLEEIERVRSAGISAEELQKAKNQLLADFYRQMKRISGKANLLGEYEVFLGDYRKLLGVGKDVEKVTAEDVQNVARRCLGPKNKTVATLIPERPEAAK